MFGALADAGVNIEMISTSEIRITCIIGEDQVDEAARALHRAFRLEQPEASRCGPAEVRPPGVPSDRDRPSRTLRQRRVDTAHRAGWLDAGEPEVCVAVADEQTAGPRPPGSDLDCPTRCRAAGLGRASGPRPACPARMAPGRHGRARDARRGRGCGRAAGRGARAQVAQRHRGRRPRRPAAQGRGRPGRDSARRRPDRHARSSASASTPTGRRVDFPTELAASMTSLRELSGGRPIDRDTLLDGLARSARAALRVAASWALRFAAPGPAASAPRASGGGRAAETGWLTGRRWASTRRRAALLVERGATDGLDSGDRTVVEVVQLPGCVALDPTPSGRAQAL